MYRHRLPSPSSLEYVHKNPNHVKIHLTNYSSSDTALNGVVRSQLHTVFSDGEWCYRFSQLCGFRHPPAPPTTPPPPSSGSVSSTTITGGPRPFRTVSDCLRQGALAEQASARTRKREDGGEKGTGKKIQKTGEWKAKPLPEGQTERPPYLPISDSAHWLQLYGRTREGHSISLHVPFWPSVVIELPNEWNDWSFEKLFSCAKKIVEQLWKKLFFKSKADRQANPAEKLFRFRVEKAYRLAGFYAEAPQKSHSEADGPTKRARFPFIVLRARSKNVLDMAVRHLRSGVQVSEGEVVKFDVAEDTMAPVLQFLQQHDLKPGGIVAVDTRVLGLPNNDQVYTHCDLEYIVHLPAPCQQSEFSVPESFSSEKVSSQGSVEKEEEEKDVLIFPQDKPFLLLPIDDMYNVIIFSIDLECVSGNLKSFPLASNLKDLLICICGTVYNTKTGQTTDVIFCIFRNHAPLDESEVKIKTPQEEAEDEDERYTRLIFYASTEEEMLRQLRDFIIHQDVDIITGYNSNRFDFPWMYDRQLLHNYFSSFFFMSRIIFHRCVMDSKKLYDRHFDVPGRMMMDTLERVMRGTERYSSYKLKDVAPSLTDGLKKIDLEHEEMFEHWVSQDPVKLARILTYCSMDARIPIEIWKKQCYLEDLIEMARVTRVFSRHLFTCGQVQKVVSLLYVYGKRLGFVLNLFKNQTSTGYEGAVVLPAKSGKYDRPISVLDFASLYPSIMLWRNICYSTFLNDGRACPSTHRAVTVKTDEGSFPWVQTCPGLLPTILRDLLAHRKIAKSAMNTTTDPTLKKVLNSRQLALKISCNSVYGFTGAQVGKWGCTPIAASVTGTGREITLGTKDLIEMKWSGYGAEVIYGDTDSLMIDFKKVPNTLEGQQMVFKLAQEITAEICKQRKEVQIVFEKVYRPFLLIRQKTYGGVKINSDTPLEWNPETDPEPEVDEHGTVGERRNYAPWQKNICSQVDKFLMLHKDGLEKAKALIISETSRLVDHKVPIAELTYTKKLREIEKYARPDNEIPILVTRKKNARLPGSGAFVDERVPYVMVYIGEDKPAAASAEDPEFAVEQKLKIDYRRYIKGLVKPLEDVLTPFLHSATSDTLNKWLTPAREKAKRYALGTKNIILSIKASKSYQDAEKRRENRASSEPGVVSLTNASDEASSRKSDPTEDLIVLPSSGKRKQEEEEVHAKPRKKLLSGAERTAMLQAMKDDELAERKTQPLRATLKRKHANKKKDGEIGSLLKKLRQSFAPDLPAPSLSTSSSSAESTQPTADQQKKKPKRNNRKTTTPSDPDFTRPEVENDTRQTPKSSQRSITSMFPLRAPSDAGMTPV